MTIISLSPLKGKRVLVTGGCGFIGSHLVKRLLGLEAKVAVMKRESSSTWRLTQDLSKLTLFIGDVTEALQVEQCICSFKPDYIYHLSAYGVDSSQKDYTKAASTNIMAIVNIFNSLKYIDCKKLILLGSSSEYGNYQGKIKEDFPLKPLNIYGSTKACATILAHQLALENQVPIVTLRPFGVFGEAEEPHKLISYVLLSILNNKEAYLTPCHQQRDYCYVENLIDGLILAGEKDCIKNEIFNLGSGGAKPLRYYVDLLYKLCPSSLKPRYGTLAYRKGDSFEPSADISKITSMLGWRPKISLEEGLLRTIHWYKDNLSLYEI